MPAQEGGAARRDRAQRQHLDPSEPVRVVIRVAMSTHDVREGEVNGRDRGRRPCGDGTHGVTVAARRGDPRDPAVTRARSAYVVSAESIWSWY